MKARARLAKSTRHNGREIIARERGSGSTTAPLIDAALKGGRFRSAESGRRDISLSRGKPNRKNGEPTLPLWAVGTPSVLSRHRRLRRRRGRRRPRRRRWRRRCWPRQHDDARTDIHSAVEIRDVRVGQADAARGYERADGRWLVGAVD